tara:strand:- start:10617 stop:11204 length:588 start_codon:yes stop_codon:yes gene_type:complete
MLKKEFKKKDVQRARNLIMGKTDASTGTQIGYNTKQEDHKEGDIWTEGRKTWTIKNGIKQTVSKLDAIKKEVFMPLCCPKCSKVMKHQLDVNSYKVHKNCHDCVIKYEHKLRINKDYKSYIKHLKTKNNLSILDEVESYLLETINKSNEGFVSEDGVIERWVGGIDKTKFTKEIKTAAEANRKRLNKELNDKKRT